MNARFGKAGLGLVALVLATASACSTSSNGPAATATSTCVPAPVAFQPGNLVTPAAGAAGVDPAVGTVLLKAYSVSSAATARLTLTATNGGSVITSSTVTTAGQDTYTATIPTLASGTTYRASFAYDPGVVTCHVQNTTDLGSFSTR